MGGSATEALGAGPGVGLMRGEATGELPGDGLAPADGLVPGEGFTRGEGEGTGNGATGSVPALKLVSEAVTTPGAVTPWML